MKRGILIGVTLLGLCGQSHAQEYPTGNITEEQIYVIDAINHGYQQCVESGVMNGNPIKEVERVCGQARRQSLKNINK